MKKQFVSILIVLCFMFSANVITCAQSKEVEPGTFEITNLQVRNGEDGAYVSEGYPSRNSGMEAGKKVFTDRADRYSLLPDYFKNAAYIVTKKGDTSNKIFTDRNVRDWLTFDINKSATVYIVDYYNADNPPSWLYESGWETRRDDSVQWATVNILNTTYTNSVYIHSKHFEVSEGEAFNVQLGGYGGKTYNNFSIFIIPDERESDGLIQFSKEELSKTNWDGEIASQLGQGTVLFAGSSVIYENGVKTRLNLADFSITPIIEENEVFLPARYLGVEAEAGAKTVAANGGQYTLEKPARLISNEIFVSTEILTKAFRKTISVYQRGLIIIKDDNTDIEEVLIQRLTGLYLTPIMGVADRMNVALPGDEVVIPNGVYADILLSFTAMGTEENPITLRAQTPGGVIITGNPEIVFGGEYIIFRDFYFEEANTNTQIIELKNAAYCRVTDNYFYHSGSSSNPGYRIILIGSYSHHNRVDHNTFERSTGQSVHIHAPDSIPLYEISTYNTVDHNYFKDIRKATEEHPGLSNGMECVQVGTSPTGRSTYSIVEYNLFEECYGDGNEIISNKSSDSIFRYNTFFNNNNSGVCIRNGNRTVWDRNYFINGLNGIRVHGYDHVITNNYFYNLTREAINLPTTDYYEITQNYRQNVNVLIANNTIINPSTHGIILGYGLRGNERYTYVPESTKIYNNLFVNTSDKINMIENRHSLNTDYQNNIISLSGVGNAGVNEPEGMLEKKIDLAGDGIIYRPADSNELKGKGVFYDEVYENDGVAQELQNKDYDIGVNQADSSAAKEKMITVDDVGPTNRWWLRQMRKQPGDINEVEPSEAPESYQAAKSKIYINVGEGYTLGYLTGAAMYSNGRRYKVPADRVSYSVIESEGIFSIEGELLKAGGAGTGKLRAVYKGCEYIVEIVAVPKALTTYTEDFSDSSFLDTAAIDGDWIIEDGKLKTINPNQKQMMIIDQKAYFEDDFRLSVDVTLKENGNTGVYNLDGFLAIGYQDQAKESYYLIGMGAQSFFQTGLYQYDGYYLDERIGILQSFLEADKTYRVELIRRGDILTLLIDDEFAGTIQAKNSLNGKIGFGTKRNDAIFDNVKVESLAADSRTDTEELKLSVKRSDVYEASVFVENPLDEDVIYRIYRNGIWFYDTKDTVYLDNTLDGVSNQFEYEVFAIDREGFERGYGSVDFTLEREPEDLFYISNIRYRTGVGGEFDTVNYYPKNKGLQRGTLSKKWAFEDLTYAYTKLDDQFIGAAYIPGVSGFKNNLLAVTPGTEEWMKFELNNKSATVYVVIFNNSKAVPGWIYNNNWKLTHHEMQVSNTRNVVLATSSHVFKKHFDVKKGEPTTVTLGGYGGIPTYAYSLIIVPDE